MLHPLAVSLTRDPAKPVSLARWAMRPEVSKISSGRGFDHPAVRRAVREGGGVVFWPVGAAGER